MGLIVCVNQLGCGVVRLLFYLLAAIKDISGFVTVRTHDDFILLPGGDTRSELITCDNRLITIHI